MPDKKSARDATTIEERILYRLSPKDVEYNPYFLRDHMDRVIKAESEGGQVSTISSARGPYQFLTKGGDNAFQTALKRVKKTYKRFGEVPSWVERAAKHNNPMKLTQSQADELYLGNIYQQKGSDAYLRKILKGDLQAGADMYSKYHHTNKDIVRGDERLSGIFGVNIPDVVGRAHGGFISPSPGRRFI